MKNRRIFAGVWAILLGFIWFMSGSVQAKELEEGKIYRLSLTMTVEDVDEAGSKYVALRNSKFQVISKKDSGDFVVKFDRIYRSDEERFSDVKWVQWDKMYLLPSMINGTHGLDIEKVSGESLTGLSSGPLIVPFKFRLDEDTLSGDATIGMYAGVTYEPGCTQSNWCFRFTPLASIGLSQVAVADGNSSENKTSVTWAVGFLITNWADLNIGLVYGQDRIGDDTWKHEGDGWISAMIGWDL